MAKDIQTQVIGEGFTIVEVYPGRTYVARCNEGDYQSRKSTSFGPPERAVKEHRRDKHGDA